MMYNLPGVFAGRHSLRASGPARCFLLCRRGVADLFLNIESMRSFPGFWPFFLLLGFLCCLPGRPLLAAPAVVLSPEEQAYLARLGSVRMCVDPDWVPFERINQEGRHEGIAADLVQLVAARVGLRLELYPVHSWEESLAASRAGRCQIMSFLNQTPERDAWLDFTQPIFSDPNVIITREEHDFIPDLSRLRGQRVALPRGTMVAERVRRDYPELQVLPTASEEESVALVSRREADMTVRSLIVAAYAIRKEGLFNLKIAGQIPEYTNQLRIGVLKEEPLLRSILDKGVATLTQAERDEIASRHVVVQVQRGIDYRLVWQVLGGALLVLALVYYWNRKLRRLNRELARLSVTDRLTGLYNRLKLDEALEGEVQRALRFDQPFSLIILDLDHFKAVNDEHGHQLGDKVLIHLARLLQDNTRETDVVGRWGGEEFMVICTHTALDGALNLAEKLRLLLQECAFPVVGPRTGSFGVSAYRAGDQARDLVARADAALYTAKHQGRNRVEGS